MFYLSIFIEENIKYTHLENYHFFFSLRMSIDFSIQGQFFPEEIIQSNVTSSFSDHYIKGYIICYMGSPRKSRLTPKGIEAFEWLHIQRLLH